MIALKMLEKALVAVCYLLTNETLLYFLLVENLLADHCQVQCRMCGTSQTTYMY